MLNKGHGHSHTIQVVKDQLDHYTHTCFQVSTHKPYVELAERIKAKVW